MNLAEQIEKLDSAESFFTLFEVTYDPEVIECRRIQLLKLFNRNLIFYKEPIAWAEYQEALSKAYCLLQRGETIPLAESSCSSCQSDCF